MTVGTNVDDSDQALFDGLNFGPLDGDALAQAAGRQAVLTKPAGALGALESVAVRLGGLQGRERPKSRPAACLLFAADHPVTKHGVSAYPSEVTAAMVQNFAGGGRRPASCAAI